MIGSENVGYPNGGNENPSRGRGQEENDLTLGFKNKLATDPHFVTLLAEIIARTPEALDMIAGALVETKEFRGMVDNMVQDAIDVTEVILTTNRINNRQI